MYGIDISNWQKGLDLNSLDVDFCICKATEGLNFIDAFCDGWIEQAKKKNILWGFYHFAGKNTPSKEAEFFYDNSRGYIGNGIPILDYETNNVDDVSWCEKFLRRFHDLSNVWPLLYISASRCAQYANSWIPSKCGLWVAGYPQPYSTFDNYTMPYDISPWEFCAIWQFSSSLQLHGFTGALDGDIAYMDTSAWRKYAGKARIDINENAVNIDDLVKDVLAGKYGSGNARVKKLGKNYNAVQARINELYNIAQDVIDGKWGNGWNRETALNGAGYPYDLVQSIVNSILEG